MIRRHERSCPSPALTVSSPALTTPQPAKKFRNKLAPIVATNIPKKPPFCSFTSFPIVSLTTFISKPDSVKRFEYFHDIIQFIIGKY